MNEHIHNIIAWAPGWPELVLILIVAVLLFGRRLPDIARSIGKSLTEFKKGLKETQDDVGKATDMKDSEEDVDRDSRNQNNG